MTSSRNNSDLSRGAALDRLRTNRVRPDRGSRVGEDVARLMGSVRRLSDQAERAAQAWVVSVPDRVAATTRVKDLRGGRLVVRVVSSADRHAADRWLRSGGLAELRRLASCPISGVRFELGAIDQG